jgi:Flp pilus assembly protein TadD
MRIGYLVAAMLLVTLISIDVIRDGATKRLPRTVVSKPVTLLHNVPMAVNDSNDPKSLNRQAISLHLKSHFVEALSLYQKAIAMDPTDPSYHNNLAMLLKDMGLLAEAEKEQRTAIRLSRKSGEYREKKEDYRYNLALILRKKHSFH